MQRTQRSISKLILLLSIFVAMLLPTCHILGMKENETEELAEKVNQLSLCDTIDSELLQLVFYHLSPQELVKCFVICKKWFTIARKAFYSR